MSPAEPVPASSPIETRFGPYGGRYVPEVLIAALDELTAAWDEARRDPAYREELGGLLRDFVGRPTPLYEAKRLSERTGRTDLPQARGPDPHRRPQDQQRGRPGAARQADGQDADHRRDRAPASTASRPRPPARYFGLECIVYMGTEDMRAAGAQRRAHGADGREGRCRWTAGARTLKEAVNAAIRDWVANVGDTHYIIGSAVGPAPYPVLVRDLQRVIGEEARAADPRARSGGCPTAVVACVGGGSNAIGIFTPSSPTTASS